MSGYYGYGYVGADPDPYAGLTDLDAQQGAESWLPHIQRYLAESKEDVVSFWRRERESAVAGYQDQLARFWADPLNRNAYAWGMKVSFARIKLADRELAKLRR